MDKYRFGNHLCLNNAQDVLSRSVSTNEEVDSLLYFDDNVVQYEIWNAENKQSYIVTYHIDTAAKTLTEFDDSEDSFHHLDDVIYSPYNESVKDASDCYDISRGVLRKNDTIIYATPFFEWYKNTPLACWLTGAFGMGTTALQMYLFKKLNYKKRLKTPPAP